METIFKIQGAKTMKKRYLVTGGAGFIGSNFVKYMLKKYRDIEIIILDALTYAGNLKTIEEDLQDPRVSFVKGNICNRELVEYIFTQQGQDLSPVLMTMMQWSNKHIEANESISQIVNIQTKENSSILLFLLSEQLEKN